MWWQQRDKDAASELCIPVLIRAGELNYIRAPPEKTVGAILHDLQLGQTYGFIIVHRDVGNNIIGRDILNGEEQIGHVRGIDYECDNPDECDFWLVDLSMEVTIFFNTYFRMITGTPSHLQRLYVQPAMTVGDVETILKKNLKISVEDQRFGLYGYAKNELVRLDGALLMTELKEREDPTEPSYFQFQMHAEAESQANLGISRASNLYMRANRGIRRRKKCWFSLQGTSLFYRPSIKDTADVRELKRVDLCKIVYRGGNKSGTLFRFDMIPSEGQGPVRVFTSPLKRRVVRWVRELRRCHPTLQINDPVTMAEVKKIKNTRHDIGSTLTRHKNEQIKELNFYQRKAIEVAEAKLQCVELDGGILLHNGVKDEAGHEVGKKWVENIRRLLLHCCRMEPTQTANDNVTQIHRILKKLRDWVGYFEEVPGSHVFVPELKTIKILIDECGFLVNCYRVYVVKLNSGLDDAIVDATQIRILEQMLDNLEDALSVSIFEYKPVRRYLVRETFKEEVPPTPLPENGPERRRSLREQSNDSVVPTKLDPYDKTLLATASLEQFQPQNLIPTTPEGPSNPEADFRKTSNKITWIKSRISGFFQRDFKKKDCSDELGDDVSFTISMENGERIADQKWAEAEELFKECASKPAHEAPTSQKESLTLEKPDENIPASGFNGFGTKKKKSPKPIADTYIPSSPELLNEKRSPSAVLKTAQDASVSPTHQPYRPLEPVRTSPEEEALLLRMIKDPRVNNLIQELKEETPEQIPVTPEVEANSTGRPSWGKSGRSRRA